MLVVVVVVAAAVVVVMIVVEVAAIVCVVAGGGGGSHQFTVYWCGLFFVSVNLKRVGAVRTKINQTRTYLSCSHEESSLSFKLSELSKG